MALRNIVKKGDEILEKKCRPVAEVTDKIRQTLDDMVETMQSASGVGLAAPQVGILRRMFVMEPEPGAVFRFVNPEITERDGTQTCEEGCLSVPGYTGTVIRPQKVKIKGLNENGETVEYEFQDFYANVALHEFDHLEGILFTDKAVDVQKNS